MTTAHWLVTADGTDQPIGGTHLLLAGVPRIEVIAHSLAQINRFTGHTARPYSVAEHSVLVCDIVAASGLGTHAQLAALMHDAHECLCGDVASPIKWQLGTAWMELEHPLALLVRKHYHLQTAHIAHRAAIKAADLQALATERRDLMRYDPARNLHWPIIDTPGQVAHPVESADLNSPARTAMTWRHHRDAFLDRYRRLQADAMGVQAAVLDARLGAEGAAA